MRVAFLSCIFILFKLTSSVAQTQACDTVYTVVDEMPVFPGGSEELMRQMRKHIIIPSGECELESFFTVTWIVDDKGVAKDWTFPRADKNCQEKGISWFKNLPDWIPGKKHGVPVCVRMMMKFCIKVN